jgi:hypothetical protein
MRLALDSTGHQVPRTKPTCLLHTWRPHHNDLSCLFLTYSNTSQAATCTCNTYPRISPHNVVNHSSHQEATIHCSSNHTWSSPSPMAIIGYLACMLNDTIVDKHHVHSVDGLPAHAIVLLLLLYSSTTVRHPRACCRHQRPCSCGNILLLTLVEATTHAQAQRRSMRGFHVVVCSRRT